VVRCPVTVVIIQGIVDVGKPIENHKYEFEQCAHDLDHIGDCLFVVRTEVWKKNHGTT